jgi:hypothetical protein
MLFGLATTAQIAGWQGSSVPNARRTGSASTNTTQGWTSYGAITATAQYKFGTASEYVSSSTQYIQTTGGSPTFMDYGTSDFTIEFWIYIPTVGSSHSSSCDLLANDVSYGFGIRLAQQYNQNSLNNGSNAKYLGLFARQQADLDYFTLPSTWPAAQWNFVAVQRKSGTMSCWVNGTLTTRSNGPNGTANGYSFASGTNIKVGTADGTNGVGEAYIDECCWSNTYRYTDTAADIPVPTASFTVDSYTTQLMHMDGTNGGTTFTNATS